MVASDPVCLATFSPSLLLMIKIIGMMMMKMWAKQCNGDAHDMNFEDASGLQRHRYLLSVYTS